VAKNEVVHVDLIAIRWDRSPSKAKTCEGRGLGGQEHHEKLRFPNCALKTRRNGAHFGTEKKKKNLSKGKGTI